MVEIEPCFSCGDEQVSDEYQRGNGHRYGCVCGASGPFCRTREQALIEWNRVAGQRWRPIETAEKGEKPLILARFRGPEMEWITKAEWGWQSLGYIQRASWSGWFVDTPAIVEDPMKRRSVKLYGTIHQEAYGESGPTHWRLMLEPPEPAPETSGYVELIGKGPLT